MRQRDFYPCALVDYVFINEKDVQPNILNDVSLPLRIVKRKCSVKARNRKNFLRMKIEVQLRQYKYNNSI